MSRLHTDTVEVVRHDDLPAQFMWRGRLYVVLEVLARWTESGGWWRQPAVLALSDGQSDGQSAGPAAAAGEPAGLDDGEQDWFRVEAGAGRAAGTGVYDLCLHTATGSWSLARVLD